MHSKLLIYIYKKKKRQPQDLNINTNCTGKEKAGGFSKPSGI